MKNYPVRLFCLHILLFLFVRTSLLGQDAACGEIIPSDYNTCISGDIPIFSSLCDVTFSMTNYFVGQQTSICDIPGSITNNPRFVAFVANGLDIVDITVIPSNCTWSGGTRGIQAALLGSCSALDPVGECKTTCPGINPINLITYTVPAPGDIIFLMVDGCDYSVCDFVIQFNSGVDFPEPGVLPGTHITGPSEVCGEVTYIVDPPFVDVCNYYWTLPDGTEIATDGPEVTFTVDPDMPPGQICVRGNNDCEPGIFVPSAPGICFDIQVANIEYEVIVVQPSCDLDNGEIEIVILDGAEPVNYTWFPGTITGSGGENLGAGGYRVTITDGQGCEEVADIELDDTDPLNPDVATVDIDCSANTLGSAVITVTGGTGTYSFIWSPDISDTNSAADLPAGDYSVTVVDQGIPGCEAQIDFSIILSGELEVDIFVEGTSCGLDNGSILVTPNGVGPYVFTWSDPGLFTGGEGNNLPAGTYDVTIVDENTGCEREESITVEDSEELEVTETLVNPDCNGDLGSIDLAVTGGSGSYLYTWSPDVSTGNGASNLDAGTYFVTISDLNIQNCRIEVQYEIEFEGELPVTIVVEDTECQLPNGSIFVTPGGIGPYTFNWDQPGLFSEGSGADLPAGEYHVTIVDETTGCEREEIISVADSDPLVANPLIVHANCDGTLGSASLSVTGGSGNYQYDWNPDVSGSNSASNLTGGTYHVTITDSDIAGCSEEISFEIEYTGDIPLAVTVEPTTCNLSNGSITVVPGGVGPYTFTWSNPPLFNDGSGMDLPAGNYTVTVVDQATGCEQVRNIFVQPSPPLNISSNVVNAGCDGTLGSIVLNVTNGSGAYDYIWDPPVSANSNANNLEAGAYSVTVTDANNSECSNTITINVGLAGDLPVDFTSLPTTCNNANGSIELFPFGDGPFGYSWVGQPSLSGSIAENLASGVYTVVITDLDNGCTQTLEIEIEDSEPLEIDFELTDPTCNLPNASVIVSGLGGSGTYTFEWSAPAGSGNSAEGLAPGLYFVTMSDLTDPDCYVVLDFEVPDSPPLEVTLLALTDTDCGLPNGSLSVEVVNGSGNYLYLWNGIDLGGSSVDNLAPGNYELTVIDLDISGCQITLDYFIDFSEAPPTPAIQGLTELCISDGIGSYVIANSDDAYIYNWQIIEGQGNIVFGQGGDSVVINWTGGQTGLICVDAWTDCGFTSVQCLPVVLINNPVINLGENITVCGNEVTLQGNISNGTGTWEVVSGPGEVSFSNVNNPAATVTVDVLGTYILKFSANQSGCISSDEITVSFNESINVSVTEDCSAVDTYIVEVSVNSGGAPFSVHSGNITGVFSGNIFTSDPVISGQAYNLVIEDANGCLSDVIVGQRECSCETDAGNMQSNTIRACVDEPVPGQHISGSESGDPAEIVFEYILFSNLLNPAGSILLSSVNGIFNFDPSIMTAGTTYYIGYVAGIDSGDGTPDYDDVCLDISNGQPVIWYDYPAADISGVLNVCGLSTTLTGTGSFTELQWILIDGPGGADFSPNTATTTNLTVSGPGIYTIGLSMVNGSTCRDTAEVVVEFLPGDLEVAFGPVIECDATGTEFEMVIELAGGNTSYVLIEGSPVAGIFTGATFRSDLIPADENYSFTFTDSNGCDTLTVNGFGECDCVTRVGTISETAITLCYGSDLEFTYDQTNEILIPGDVVTYILYEGSLNVIDNVIATSNSPIFAFPAGIIPGQTYYIKAFAGQDDGNGFADWEDPCLAGSISRPVIWYAAPSGEISEVEPVCGFSVELLINSDFSAILWQSVSGPSAGSFDPSAGNSTVFTVSAPGVYTVSATLSNEMVCETEIFTTVEFLPDDLEVDHYDIFCDDPGIEFEVEIALSTTKGPIVFIAGESSHSGTLAGNIFTSEVLPTGESYTFAFTDAGECDTLIVSGTGLCDCKTRVGTITETAIEACEGDGISFTYNDANEILIPGDVVTFILYDGTPEAVSTVISSSNIPYFDFPDGIVPGRTYYIRVLAGQDNGAGVVDADDPCLVQSVSRPVIWYEVPSGRILEVDPLCGNSISLEAEGSFDEVHWSVTSGPAGWSLNEDTGESVTLSVAGPGIYTVLIEMVSEGICTGTFSTEVEFLSSAIEIISWDITCNELGTEFEIVVELSGGSGDYIILPESTVEGNFINSVFTSMTLPSDSEFILYFTDANACDTFELADIGLCNCITRVGTITNALIEACEGDDISFNYNNAGEVLDPDDTLLFILYEGTPSSIFNILAVSENPAFGFPAGVIPGNTYYIQAMAGNNDGAGGIDTDDPCLRRSTARPVIWYPMPVGTINGLDPVCGTSALLEISGDFDEILWSLISGPAQLTFADPEGESTEITAVSPGQYIISAVLTNGGICSVTVETHVIFIESDLRFEDKELICDDTNTSFSVQFTMAGGTGTYLLDPSSPDSGSWEGNVFTSEAFTNGAPYEFRVTDSDGCEVIVVTGVGDCNCESEAGAITDTFIELCDGESFEFSYDNTNEFLDADDVLLFILYEGTVNRIDAILAVSPAPSFSFPAGIELGKIYFIQAVAGSSDGTGGIVEDDPCLDRSVPRQVVWRPIPQAIAMVDGVLGCENESVQLFGSSDLGGIEAGITILWFNQNGEGIGETGNVVVNEPGEYSVLASNFIGCSTRDSVMVEAEEGIITEVNARIKDPTCVGSEDGFIEIVNITGGAPPFLYSFDGGPFSEVGIWDNLADGIYNVRIRDANGCETSRNVPVNNPSPLELNIGLDLVVSEGQEITVGSSIFPESAAIVNYLWTFNAVNLDCHDCNVINFIPQESGILSLLVTDANGCRAEDAINIVVLKARRVIYIPNVFTPNGDQFNDVFRIYNYDDVEIINSFSIFDRWGSFIYGAENVAPADELASWNGKYNGKELDQAVYVYQIQLTFKNGDVRVYAGDVTLLK